MNVKSAAVVIFILGLIGIFYSNILDGFFQHDEWQTFATEYSKGGRSVMKIVIDSFSPKSSHFSPLFDLTFNLSFNLFGLNYLGYAIVSIALHLVSVLLVFLLVYLLTKKMLLVSLSTLLFGLNASSHQATSWVIADINTQGATIFGLLSVLTLIYGLQREGKEKIGLLISLILFVISLLFKEITVAFFAFLPLSFLLFVRADTKKYKKVYFLVVLSLGILYFALRLYMLSLLTPDSKYVVIKDQSLSEIVYNTVTFPAKMLVQSVIPTGELLNISKVTASLFPQSISGQFETTARDLFVENVVLQGVDFSIFIFVFIIVLIFLKRKRKEPLIKVILFSFVFVILNSFIYALSPGRSGSIPVVDSRNVYFPAVGTSIFLATIAYVIMRGRATRVVLLLAPLVFLHMYWLNEQLTSHVSVGATRRGILQQIKREYPNLPKKTVFYVESDTPYYGMAENIPPFETGLGQALLVWYHSTEKFPLQIFENRFLRFITDQGYREVDKRGFGYFRDMSLLKEAIKQNSLSPESIISYSYYGGSNVLRDTTIQTRKNLARLNYGSSKQ